MSETQEPDASAKELLKSTLQDVAKGYGARPPSGTERIAAGIALCHLEEETVPENVLAAFALLAGHHVASGRGPRIV